MKATNTAKASGRIQALAGKLRPKSFRAKLTLAISLVFLIAMGSATLVQTIVVNSMFTYATTVTAKNPEMQVESQHSGSGRQTPGFRPANVFPGKRHRSERYHWNIQRRRRYGRR